MAEHAVLQGAARAEMPPPPLPQQRVAVLLGELAPARRAAIDPALAALLAGAPPGPGDPAWSAFAEGLAHDLLSDFDVTREQIQDMLRLLKIKDRRMVEVFQAFYQRLRQTPLAGYGGLDEAFNPIEFEDFDFCYRARAEGGRCIYEPGVEMHHWESITSQGTQALPNTYLIIKHGLLFKERWRHAFEREDGPADADCRWVPITMPGLNGERTR